MEIDVGPTDCLTALPTGPKHSLFEHFFFFFSENDHIPFVSGLKGRRKYTGLTLQGTTSTTSPRTSRGLNEDTATRYKRSTS